MRALLPEPSDDVDPHAWYGAGWLEGGGLRVNFVSSVDGSVSAAGLSRGLQTPGDNQVFAALRDLADVVLVGSGTAHAEGYRASHPSARRQAIRRAHGLRSVPPIAVVSRRLHVDPTSALFTDAEPEARTIVLTGAAGDPGVRAALASVADVVVCGDDEVDLPTARRALEDRGLTRILGEGGPSLFADLVAAGVVDELCLSVSPLLAGPGAGRITAGTPWGDGALPGLRLIGLLEEDGALFCRYRFTDG